MKRAVVRCLLLSGLAVLILTVALAQPQRDFIEYWTVGHLFLQGENCYSLREVFHFEQALNWPEPLPLIPLNPPWILPFLAPLGLLRSYVVGWIIWTVVMTGALAVSSLLLMDLYAPDVRLPKISDSLPLRALFAFSFYPAILSVRFAQIGGLILLGIAGFLWLQKHGYPALSGSALALAALKPQLVYLVFLTIIVVSWRRSVRILAGFAGTISLLTVIAYSMNPSAFRGYWELATGPYAQVYPSAVGAILRLALGSANTFYLQFVPPLFGFTWLFFFLKRHGRKGWNWLETMPTLIAVSVLTTPWGWLFDQVILAVPIVALFAASVRLRGELPRKMILLYTVLNVGIVLASLMESFPLFYAVAPCMLLVMMRFQRRAVNCKQSYSDGPSPRFL